MRAWALICVALGWAAPAVSQRAQLPRKGRVFESARAPERTSVRTLPRKRDVTTAAPSALDDYLTTERAPQPQPRATPEDRLRSLVGSTGRAMSVSSTAAVVYDPLPRR